MKKSIFSKLGAGALVLTLVTASLVGGTFAKYTSTVTGSATATVAKWAVDLKSGGTSVEGATLKLENANVAITTTDNKLAPGTHGTLALTLDGTGTEVDYTYTVTLDKTSLGGIPIDFYEGTDNTGTPITFAGNTAELKKDAVGTKTTENINIYWEWDTASSDTDDTALGEAGTSGALALEMVATQKTQ